MGIVEEVATIHYNGLIEEFKAIGIDANIDYDHLKKKWNQYNGFIRTHEEDGKTVGFISNDLDGSMIYVDPDYQRQGIGSKLLNTINIPSVWVMGGNTKAEKFYKKNGFEPVESRVTTKLGHNIIETKWVR